MEKLLTTYSLSDILVFLVIFALAVKSVVTFYDWAMDRVRQVFNKELDKNAEKENLDERLQITHDMVETLANNQKEMSESIQKLADKVDMLIESDKDSIKSFLTKEHHYFCYQKGWIDDYSLDCCEKMYGHYRDEGGNSFIEHFMEELRALPTTPPQED